MIARCHRLVERHLDEEGRRIGLGSGFSLIGDGERRSIVKQLAREVSPTLDPAAVGDAISMWKNAGLDYEEAAGRKGDGSAEEKVLLKAYELYQLMMKAQRSV